MSHVAGHAVVILAAGASTRLGQPKQLLRRDGETLLHRMVRLANATAPDRLLVVLPPGQPALTAAVHGLPCTVAVNPEPQRGMASSLATVAAQVQRFDQVLVMACDQPALQEDHLHALLASARDARCLCAATVFDHARGVPAVVPGDWFTTLRAEGGDSGFRARLRSLEEGSIALLQAPALGLDIDTPADLRRAREQGWIDP